MDISGKLIQVLQEQSGEGRNGKWAKCDFVIETQEKFPKKVCITAWNELIGTIKAMPAGADLKVAFDLSSREYNGKWYTDIKAWKIESGSGSAASGNTGSSYQAPDTSGANSHSGSQERHISDDDLPF